MLTDRFDQALLYATAVHGGQVRKGKAIPYVAHLLMVTGLVLEHGGSEDEAIGALLHDAAEDMGASPSETSSLGVRTRSSRRSRRGCSARWTTCPGRRKRSHRP